nr:MAG TPA: acriflavine resistance protein B [Caudoviricetes sp.]
MLEKALDGIITQGGLLGLFIVLFVLAIIALWFENRNLRAENKQINEARINDLKEEQAARLAVDQGIRNNLDRLLTKIEAGRGEKC